MPVRALVVFVLAVIAHPRVAVSAPAADASAVRMSVSAGLAGAGRLGRWMPVDVDLQATGSDIDGTLVITWGNARVEQLVSLPAPSRRTFHLFVRTGDVRDTVRAAIIAAGREIAVQDAPVHVLGNDEVFTVCLSGDSIATASGCSAVIASGALPRTWRGYDTADHVMVSDTARLDRAQQEALLTWRALRAAEERGGGTRPSIALVETSRWASARGVLVGYAVILALIAIPSWRPRCGAALVAVVLVAVVASVSAELKGRSSPLTIRHSTLVTQYSGAPGAVVDIAAVAAFASDGPYAVTPSVSDGAMNVGVAYGAPAPLRFDTAGRPLLAGTFGLGAQQQFQLETIAPAVLDVAQHDAVTRITNVSSQPLADCALPASFTPRLVARLEPHQSVDVAGDAAADDPFIRCRMPASPVTFADPAHAVVMAGDTTLAYEFVREDAGE